MYVIIDFSNVILIMDNSDLHHCKLCVCILVRWLPLAVSRWQNALRDKRRSITALRSILKGGSLWSAMLSWVSKALLLPICLIPFKSPENETWASLKSRFSLAAREFGLLNSWGVPHIRGQIRVDALSWWLLIRSSGKARTCPRVTGVLCVSVGCL